MTDHRVKSGCTGLTRVEILHVKDKITNLGLISKNTQSD